MNVRQQKFAELVAQGRPAGRAYEEAGYSARGHTADSAGQRLLMNVEVKAFIEEMKAKSKSNAIMSLTERKEWLSNAIRTPLSDIDDDSPLCSEKTTRIETDSEGKSVADIEKIKKVDPLRSMDILNKLEGDYAPERHEHTVTSVKDIIAKARSNGS